MGLTTKDLKAIRGIVRQEVGAETEPLDNQLKGVKNHIKEIYDILTENNILVVQVRQ